MYNNIFDTHGHYADHAFDEDRDEILRTLPEKGVRYVTLPGSDDEDSAMNAELSQKYDYIYAAAGFHPEYADRCPADHIDITRAIIKNNPKAVAVGEIGLDYHYEGYNREKQIRIFEEQMALAKELDLPVIIHSRDAVEDTLSILKSHRLRGVVHCFSGSAETAKEIIKLGMYIGFTGVLTFKNAKKALKALEEVPMDRLLLETDCPYMAPVPLRGKRNESAFLLHVISKLAACYGVDDEEVARQTTINVRRVFTNLPS